MTGKLRLRTLGLVMIVLAFAAGGGAAALWFSSNASWKDHLTRAYVAGITLDAALRRSTQPPTGIRVDPVPEDQAALIASGAYLRLNDVPKPAYATNISLRDAGLDPLGGEALSLVLISGTLRYGASDVVSDEGQSAAEKLGAVTRLLATYCSEPMLFARVGDGPWLRVEGSEIWDCAAAPRDMRLAALLLAVVALAALGSMLIDTVAHFDRFARALTNRSRLGGPESYSTDGPAELSDIVSAVNAYLEREREQLRKRAVVLSGVSHDLGTPATRLRLRTALIPEPELRAKFEADIDSMTGMIDSVLTYTRAELSSEEPRTISLQSLVQSIVDDYADTGRPVSLHHAAAAPIASGTSIFSAIPGHGGLGEEPRILVTARPISLQRAVNNLIDNALKYGRRASVGLVANADTAVITVEDEASDMSPEDIEQVFAPFQRGSNATSISGFGLGLTIVDTVAEQHGGRLYFETGAQGLRACLEIGRG